MTYSLQSFLTFIETYAARLQELKDTLNTLDNRIGDGDHGTNMERGFTFAHQQLQVKPPSDLAMASNSVAMALLGHVGGASGPLYGTVFMKLGGVFGQHTEVDEAVLIEGLQAAKKGIMDRGKAEFGDKTMLDVWEPSVSFLLENTGEDRFRYVIPVVRDAVLATKDRVAKKGRAAYLGQRSQGTCDPGSVSSGLFFDELVKSYQQEVGIISWETLVL